MEYVIELTIQDVNVIHSRTNRDIKSWIHDLVLEELYGKTRGIK